MAISQMQKLSLILSKERLDEVLLTLQELRDVEIRSLQDQERWQQAFAEQTVSLPPIYGTAEDSQGGLTGEEALYYLSKRQQALEAAIKQLKEYLPKAGLWQSLRQKQRTLTFDVLQQDGCRLDHSDVLEQVQELFKEYSHLTEVDQKLTEEIDRLSNWQELETTPAELARFRHVKGLVGTIPNSRDNTELRALKAAVGLDFQEVYRTETEYGLILFLHPRKEGQEPINLETYHFQALDYPYSQLPKDRLETLRSEKEVGATRKSELEKELQQAKPLLENLEVQLEYILDLYARQTAKQQMASSQHLAVLEGWIETEQAAALKKRLIRQFGSLVLIEEAGVEEADWEDVPIKLRNHPLVEPFELVTEMYSLPKYHEKDPTPVLAPFYFAFFGMMVADLGYGLLMIMATVFALRVLSLSKGSARLMRFFSLLGIAVSLWGLVYGSFFGYTMPVQLISTTDDVMTILIMSVAFGFVTVVTGLFLGGRQKVRMKEYADAYNNGFAWCMILIGILLLALGNLLPHLAFLAVLGQWLAIINAIGILLVSVVKARGVAGLGSGLYNLYNVSGYVGDLVSFTRLMALGLSGASIGSAFNLIVGLFPKLALPIAILIFILLHAINIFLSLLSGYVHGARLMFVEFFGKFYEGGGRAFNPLKPAEKHMTIINEVHLEDK